MISATSRAGQLDDVLEQLAGRSGRSASLVLVAPRSSDGISTSTLAGRGAPSAGASPIDQPLDLADAEGQRDVARRSSPAAGQKRVDDRLGEDPADDPRQDVAQQADPTATRSPAPARQPWRGATWPTVSPQQRGQQQAGRRPPATRRPLGPLVVVRDASARAGWPRSRADLLQPAPRIGPQGLGQRDRDQVQRQDQQHPGPASSPGSARPPRTLPSPADRARPSADQRERVERVLPASGQDLVLAPPHRRRVGSV